MKGTRAFSMLKPLLSDGTESSGDNALVAARRESHFTGFSPIASQSLVDRSLMPVKTSLVNGGPGKHAFF